MATLSAVKVLLVTSDREQCGIREYGKMLKEAVEGASDVQVEEFPFPFPDKAFDRLCSPQSRPDVLHVNHHAALHAAWRPSHIEAVQKLGVKVVVTQHDSFETHEIMLKRGFLDARGADLLIVHEPVRGLEGPRVWFMRQPIPEAPEIVRSGEAYRKRFKSVKFERYVGSIGFLFPWKGFATLVEAARRADWGCRLILPGVTVAQAEELMNLHPEGLEVMASFWPRDKAIAALATCDAIAFPYVTGNSGTSGAMRLGVAARRPVVVSPASVNRQTLDFEGGGPQVFPRVSPDPEVIAAWLRTSTEDSLEYWADRAAELAWMDGWARRGPELAERYRRLVG